MFEGSSEIKSPFGLSKTLLIRPSRQTDRLARIVVGDNRAAYRDVSGSAVLTIVLLSEFGDVTAVIMSIAGRAEIGLLTYCPRSLYGNGPTVRRGDNCRTVALADRQWIAEFFRGVLSEKGGQA